MGALKLRYQNFETPLKVVYRKTIVNQKGVQSCLSVDPLQFEYPHYTPYQYAGNKPITFIDLDGLEEEEPELNSGNLLYTGNVILVNTEDQFNELNSTKNKNWDILLVDTLEDASNQLENYLSSPKIDGNKLKNLVFKSHGDGEGQLSVITPESDTIVFPATLGGEDENAEPLNPAFINYQTTGKDNFKLAPDGMSIEERYPDEVNTSKLLINLGDYVEKGGNIFLTACDGGDDFFEGLSMGVELSKSNEYKGKRLFMNQDNSKLIVGLDEKLTRKLTFEEGWIMFINGEKKPQKSKYNIRFNSTGDEPVSFKSQKKVK
ncbi:MAG: hypothetical protein HN704_15000 [Bacteroidetes bacterium]|jgi:hypothetical protein|nr:hypothetical protein [Bacteroidota bacterium]MBT6686135.1 hypothetical protein [Bacteroidota bacterium]MBT7144650.1 hypothetical protein [Bacteroidota bacterium]MBT7492905.1 hypothetical protein [Bacteroidota bacterium]